MTNDVRIEHMQYHLMQKKTARIIRQSKDRQPDSFKNHHKLSEKLSIQNERSWENARGKVFLGNFSETGLWRRTIPKKIIQIEHNQKMMCFDYKTQVFWMKCKHFFGKLKRKKNCIADQSKIIIHSCAWVTCFPSFFGEIEMISALYTCHLKSCFFGRNNAVVPIHSKDTRQKNKKGVMANKLLARVWLCCVWDWGRGNLSSISAYACF